jgi:hypothetical protein
MKQDQAELFLMKTVAEDDDSDNWATVENDDFDASAFDTATDDSLYKYGFASGDKGKQGGAVAGSYKGFANGPNAAPMGNQGGAQASSFNGFANGQNAAPMGNQGEAQASSSGNAFASEQNIAPVGNPGATGDGFNSGWAAAGSPGTDTGTVTVPIPTVKTDSMYGPIESAATGTDESSDMYDALANSGAKTEAW